MGLEVCSELGTIGKHPSIMSPAVSAYDHMPWTIAVRALTRRPSRTVSISSPICRKNPSLDSASFSAHS